MRELISTHTKKRRHGLNYRTLSQNPLKRAKSHTPHTLDSFCKSDVVEIKYFKCVFNSTGGEGRRRERTRNRERGGGLIQPSKGHPDTTRNRSSSTTRIRRNEGRARSVYLLGKEFDALICSDNRTWGWGVEGGLSFLFARQWLQHTSIT